jgi:hypothetical protein
VPGTRYRTYLVPDCTYRIASYPGSRAFCSCSMRRLGRKSQRYGIAFWRPAIHSQAIAANKTLKLVNQRLRADVICALPDKQNISLLAVSVAACRWRARAGPVDISRCSGMPHYSGLQFITSRPLGQDVALPHEYTV